MLIPRVRPPAQPCCSAFSDASASSPSSAKNTSNQCRITYLRIGEDRYHLICASCTTRYTVCHHCTRLVAVPCSATSIHNSHFTPELSTPTPHPPTSQPFPSSTLSHAALLTATKERILNRIAARCTACAALCLTDRTFARAFGVPDVGVVFRGVQIASVMWDLLGKEFVGEVVGWVRELVGRVEGRRDGRRAAGCVGTDSGGDAMSRDGERAVDREKAGEKLVTKAGEQRPATDIATTKRNNRRRSRAALKAVRLAKASKDVVNRNTETADEMDVVETTSATGAAPPSETGADGVLPAPADDVVQAAPSENPADATPAASSSTEAPTTANQPKRHKRPASETPQPRPVKRVRLATATPVSSASASRTPNVPARPPPPQTDIPVPEAAAHLELHLADARRLLTHLTDRAHLFSVTTAMQDPCHAHPFSMFDYKDLEHAYSSCGDSPGHGHTQEDDDDDAKQTHSRTQTLLLIARSTAAATHSLKFASARMNCARSSVRSLGCTTISVMPATLAILSANARHATRAYRSAAASVMKARELVAEEEGVVVGLLAEFLGLAGDADGKTHTKFVTAAEMTTTLRLSRTDNDFEIQREGKGSGEVFGRLCARLRGVRRLGGALAGDLDAEV
ncbi:uncharacterized protein EV422DRAFT_569087 [Fimicolochytrium jonesii]|uniref:uncharacterized protein n=1 Tax=Fimicolochytrium jonesii TaxID=1396493 RepID=UPI0022FDF66F|nr:uncharacterized protein EV422DRAFT_569087 [Fimicolochytrium jonesii]KAI8819209.1 hypothetical protein EV422DRAFT_569087 [Fimicolochytrium jonesii]